MQTTGIKNATYLKDLHQYGPSKAETQADKTADKIAIWIHFQRLFLESVQANDSQMEPELPFPSF